eukprot:CAMPEP_0202443656 /NCGR_PEP_ID=MMETSP1360-20130828/2859_1 /ASSEMBLY_ACC=CAM_ASM_000848 /TAXON_ID=515479 /ORGANISM="Licmophora paradoxa, Strain CCMP2313" /LENGTH=125 /DNA_ID=CAMNT_0049059391 /DNA_START=59 /DNA_END=436 /DNA_ORIENTATION=-
MPSLHTSYKSFSPLRQPIHAEPVNQRALTMARVIKVILMTSVVCFAAACTCCAASKAINGTFIPNPPKYKFDMNIRLSEEEKEALQKGRAKLQLSLGNQSIKFVIPPNQIWYDGNVGYVAGRVRS